MIKRILPIFCLLAVFASAEFLRLKDVDEVIRDNPTDEKSTDYQQFKSVDRDGDGEADFEISLLGAEGSGEFTVGRDIFIIVDMGPKFVSATLSETADFFKKRTEPYNGLLRIPYKINFESEDDYGLKTIYVQFKFAGDNISKVYTSTIYFIPDGDLFGKALLDVPAYTTNTTLSLTFDIPLNASHWRYGLSKNITNFEDLDVIPRPFGATNIVINIPDSSFVSNHQVIFEVYNSAGTSMLTTNHMFDYIPWKNFSFSINGFAASTKYRDVDVKTYFNNSADANRIANELPGLAAAAVRDATNFTNISWQLSEGVGTKTVYVGITNLAHGLSRILSQDILTDLPTPGFTIFNPLQTNALLSTPDYSSWPDITLAWDTNSDGSEDTGWSADSDSLVINYTVPGAVFAQYRDIDLLMSSTQWNVVLTNRQTIALVNTAPTVSIGHPDEDGNITPGAPLAFLFSMTDAETAAGGSLDLYTNDVFMASVSPSATSYNLTGGLPLGSHSFTAIGMDRFGAADTNTVTFAADRPPVISISDIDSLFAGEPYRIEVNDPDGSLLEVTLVINGEKKTMVNQASNFVTNLYFRVPGTSVELAVQASDMDLGIKAEEQTASFKIIHPVHYRISHPLPGMHVARGQRLILSNVIHIQDKGDIQNTSYYLNGALLVPELERDEYVQLRLPGYLTYDTIYNLTAVLTIKGGLSITNSLPLRASTRPYIAFKHPMFGLVKEPGAGFFASVIASDPAAIELKKVNYFLNGALVKYSTGASEFPAALSLHSEDDYMLLAVAGKSEPYTVATNFVRCVTRSRFPQIWCQTEDEEVLRWGGERLYFAPVLSSGDNSSVSVNFYHRGEELEQTSHNSSKLLFNLEPDMDVGYHMIDMVANCKGFVATNKYFFSFADRVAPKAVISSPLPGQMFREGEDITISAYCPATDEVPFRYEVWVNAVQVAKGKNPPLGLLYKIPLAGIYRIRVISIAEGKFANAAIASVEVKAIPAGGGPIKIK